MQKIKFVVLALLALGLGACAHHVPFNAPETFNYPNQVPRKALFYMEPAAKAAVWSGRSAAAGIANKWVVPIGQTVETYADSYLENGFQDFQKIASVESKPNHDLLIKITNIQYYMANQAAHVDMDFVVQNNGGTAVFTKKYNAIGPSGGGRVAFGGAFAQKSAIRQSTHVALETIFRNFMNDAIDNYRRW